MATQDQPNITTAPPATEAAPAAPPTQLIIYSRSSFFYWWPIWACGYVLAFATWIGGVPMKIAPDGTELGHVKAVLIHPNPTLGVIFATVFFLVLIITNVAVRGVWSVVVLLAIGFLTVLMALLGLWDPLLAVLPELAIYANLGFYLTISTLVFAVWLFTFLVSDRLNYWRVTPGQVTYQHVVGGGEKSYDTRGMVFEQLQEDLFRHWILGFGSGDIRISTTGARREELFLHNVLFVNKKVKEIQSLIAMKPDQNAPVKTA